MSVGVSGIETLAIIIVGATVLSLLANKLKQPTVIAYILTGLLLGSVGLGIVSPNEITKLLSELGLAFLLFLIGLEIDLEEIKEIVRPVILIAGLQMAITASLGYLIAQVLGFNAVTSLFIGAASMFSSTAVVVKLLSDKDEAASLPGKLDIGILLIQDLAVIILLAIVSTGGTSIYQLGFDLLKVIGMITVLGSLAYISSMYFLPKIFKKIAENKHAFFVHSVGWAFLLITVSSKLGISSEIGAFLAGIALGQIPYSSEIRERVRPLTDFFMAIFFVNIGLNLTSNSLIVYWKEALAASAILMAGKFIIIFLITDRLKFTPKTSFKTSINMSQISEFSLIFGALGVSQGYITAPILGFLSIIAVTTMGISSYFITYNSILYKKFRPLLESFESEEKQDLPTSPLEDHAVVVGYNTLSKKMLETLEDYFTDIVVIDKSKDNVEELANSSYKFIYGDFRHPEIREAAGTEDAKFLVSVVPSFEVNSQVLTYSDRDATKFVEAETVENAGELYEKGAHYVIVENIVAGEKIGEYIETYLEDREDFLEKVEPQIQKMKYHTEEKNG